MLPRWFSMLRLSSDRGSTAHASTYLVTVAKRTVLQDLDFRCVCPREEVLSSFPLEAASFGVMNQNPAPFQRPLRPDLAPSFIAALNDETDAETPTVRIARAMLEDACHVGATDVHIEPHRNGVRVRFRIDGSVRDICQLTPVQSRILSNLGLFKDDKSQDRVAGRSGRVSNGWNFSDSNQRTPRLPILGWNQSGVAPRP